MQNVVSFEMAKALKDAGFPQPQPDLGQIWFTEDGDFVMVCYRNGVGVAFVFNDLESRLVGISLRGFKDLTFAPTPQDIQVAFLKDHRGTLDVGIRPFLGANGGHSFCCLEKTGMQIDYRETAHCIKDNPADATGQMYLNFSKSNVIKMGDALVYKENKLSSIFCVKQVLEDGGTLPEALEKVNNLEFY